jgi:TDG/mug DNA glycosylase family protein
MTAIPEQASLPDYLRPGLRIVFVGINPSIYSVHQGHYFARSINRFWPALSASALSVSIRTAVGRERLVPSDDATLLEYGIGFTDVVKRPTPNVSQLTSGEFRAGAAVLVEKLDAAQPMIACFQGLTGYRPFVRYGLSLKQIPRDLGPQPHWLGHTRIFVVPSPSPANAHFTPADQIHWYDELDEFCRAISGE